MKNELRDLIENPEKNKKVSVVKLQMVSEKEFLYGALEIHSADDVMRIAKPVFENADREMMAVLCLNTKLNPIALEVVSIGGISSTFVDVRNMFKSAILSNSSFIICMHNHPSGDCTPSNDDKDITKKISVAGEILDIQLLDHLIVGMDSYYSFKAHHEL